MNKAQDYLSDKDVKHVALLAHLELSEREVKKFGKQLSSVIEYINKLREIKTKDVIPTSQVTHLENVFREDGVKESLSQKAVLSNAPESYKGYFKVDAVLEG